MSKGFPAARRRWLVAAGAGLGAAAMAVRAVAQVQEEWPPVTAYPSGSWSPGRWVWADLFAEDVDASERLYRAAFGWSFERTNAPGRRPSPRAPR